MINSENIASCLSTTQLFTTVIHRLAVMITDYEQIFVFLPFHVNNYRTSWLLILKDRSNGLFYNFIIQTYQLSALQTRTSGMVVCLVNMQGDMFQTGFLFNIFRINSDSLMRPGTL